MKVLHLFAGAGGSHLCGDLLGWESVGSVEINEYCKQVLKHHNPDEKIHHDIRDFKGTELNGIADGICGGFPCQDISSAGPGEGITGERSGLWKEFARVIGEVRPKWAFIENSPLLRIRGLEVCLGDLAALGYDAEWSTFTASAVGAPHKRDRIWILAYPGSLRGGGLWQQMGKPGTPRQRWKDSAENGNPWSAGDPGDRAGNAQPVVGRVADGVAHRVHRLAALGNGWVPHQAAEAFKQLWMRAFETPYETA